MVSCNFVRLKKKFEPIRCLAFLFSQINIKDYFHRKMHQKGPTEIFVQQRTIQHQLSALAFLPIPRKIPSEEFTKHFHFTKQYFLRGIFHSILVTCAFYRISPY